jgi:hypothetical protein
VSPVWIVVWSAPVAATVLGAVIVSSPAEPTIASTLVVSDQTWNKDKLLIFKDINYIFYDILYINYAMPIPSNEFRHFNGI